MTIQYNEQDDYDHFGTQGISIRGFDLDNMSVREAMKRMMNAMLKRGVLYVGDLSLVSLRSIEKTELLLEHLTSNGYVKKVDEREAYEVVGSTTR